MADQAKPKADKKPPLNRDRIIAAAIEYADTHGLESLSMRNLAKTMGVEAMSLYNHVDGKEAILDHMADVMASEIARIAAPGPGPDDWRAAMRRRAKASRQVFARHPWASLLLDTRLNASPERLAYYDAMLGALLGAGFSPSNAVRAFMVMDSFLYGFEAQLRATQSTAAPADEMASRLSEELSGKQYPHLALVSAQVAAKGYDAEAEFEAAFELILETVARLQSD